MIDYQCLNHNDPQVKMWIDNVGIEETYRQYVINNNILPDWNNKYLTIPFEQASTFLSRMLPVGEFKIESINNILSNLPLGVQAAFWNDTFYFRDSVTKGELGEEAFHSIISTILTNSQREEFYRIGEQYIKENNIDTSAFVVAKSLLELTTKQRKERVIEEAIASKFREWYTTPVSSSFFNDTAVGRFLQDLFDTIRKLFGVRTNRDYIQSLFNDIKNGKYKDAKVIYSENATPSTYLIVGRNSSGMIEEVGEAESEQILRNLRANYFKLRSEMEATPSEVMDEVINRAVDYYNSIGREVVSRAFTKKIESINEETLEDEEIDNPDYIELIKQLNDRITPIEKMMFDVLEEDGGELLTDENITRDDTATLDVSDFNSANEAGFDSISSWVKAYLDTVSISTTLTLEDGRQLDFVEAIDPNRVYYGTARALNNSGNDFERLIKLIAFGELGGNSASKALLYKLITDVTGKKDAKGVIDSIKNDYNNEYLVNGDASIINRYINEERSYILNNILKGFDLWSRTNIFQTVSPETGSSVTTNANVNNAVKNQLANWQQEFVNRADKDASKLEGLVTSVFSGGDFNAKLENAIRVNREILFDVLGIDVSEASLRWLLLNNTTPTSAEDKLMYNAFKGEIATYDTAVNIKSLLVNIKNNVKDVDNTYEESGIKSRLETLAKINALFDESVFESSYTNAEGKTIYGFQWKTYDLEFVANLQKTSFTDSLLNNGLVSYKTNEDGEDVYLNESSDFLENNMLLKKMYNKIDGRWIKDVNSTFSKILPYFKLESVDGIRQTEDVQGLSEKRKALTQKLIQATTSRDREQQIALAKEIASLDEIAGREGNGVTFSNIQTKDFDIFRLNTVVGRSVKVEGETLYPHYIANLEAKRTADFIYLPEIKEELVSGGTLNNNAISLIKEEVRKEYNRIKRVNREFQELVDSNLRYLSFNDKGIANIDSTTARLMLGRDAYEKYHTGKVIREVSDSGVSYRFDIRALQFTDNILGVLDKEYMKTILTEAAINNRELNDVWKDDGLDAKIKDHWKNVIFKAHYDRLKSNNIIPLLDRRWKVGGEFNTPKFEKFIVSSFINTLSFNQLMHGDGALLFKNDGADFAKRKGGANAAISSAETFVTAPSLGITEVKNRIKYVTANEMVSRVAYAPNETIDQADAQNYATTEYKRYLLWSRGKLDKFLAKTLDDIELGLPLTPRQEEVMLANASFLNVDKTVAYNGVQYLKKSDFMLTKELTSVLTLEAQEQLNSLSPYSEEWKAIRMDENNWIAAPDTKWHHELRQNMEGWRINSEGRLVKDNKKKYDLYMPTSASKMLNVNVFNPSTGWNNIDGSVMHIDAKNYGLQLENPAGKEKIIDPSQMLEIIYNEQLDGVEVWHKGELKNITDIGELYNDYLTMRDNTMLDLAESEIFNENGEFDASTFYPKMITSLINSGADPQVIELFKMENGRPVYNPNMGVTKEKFTNALFSHFTKGILQQKVAGDALAHVSSYGFKPVKRIRKVEIGKDSGVFDYTWDVVQRGSRVYNSIAQGITRVENLDLENTQYEDVIYDPTLESDGLRSKLRDMYESEQLYFTDELRHLKPRYRYIDFGTEYDVVDPTPIAYYSESLMPILDRENRTVNNTNKYNFGVRIPSQDKHSAVNVEIVGTLPMYYGNSITTAKEIVTISGSDFDIDKLFLHKPHIYKDDNGVFTQYGEGDERFEYIEFLKSYSRDFKEGMKNISWDDTNRVEALMTSLRLPINGDNAYTINNELLYLKQIGLTNEGTLKERIVEGETIPAIYKTAATMDVLKNLDKEEMFKKDGKSMFSQTDPLPNHIFAKHSSVHTKNSVGKANISPYVNANLSLILAIKAGWSINPDFQISINGHTMKGFSYMSSDNKRAFDTISSLISAATDEAKEQLNAKYNLNLEGAGIVKTFVSLGFPLSTSIAFVNQPIVQQFLKAKADRIQTIYLDDEYKSDEDIVNELLGEGETYVGEYGNDQLAEGMRGNSSKEFDRRILNDLAIIDKVTAQLNQLTRFLKVKKGFTGGLQQLDDLNSAIESLGFNLSEDYDIESFEKSNPINSHKTFTDERIKNSIPQVVNVIENVVPLMNKITRQLLLDRNRDVRFLKNSILGEFKKLNIKETEAILKEVESYIFMRLYMEEVVDSSLLTNNLFTRGEDHSTVGQTFISLKQEVERINNEGAVTPDEKILKNLYGTSILKRLSVRQIETNNVITDELRLNTFAKLSVDEQDTLINSFGVMLKNLNYLSDDYLEFKNLPKQLFAYWVMKDGFQSKFGSISKLFPVYTFKEHSNSIDRALADSSDIFNQLKTVEGTFDVYFKDIMSRLAYNSFNRNKLNNFYIPKNRKAATLHDQGSFNINLSKLQGSDEVKLRMLANYPFSAVQSEEFGIHVGKIPFYLKTSVKDQQGNKILSTLQLDELVYLDGTVINRKTPTFTSEVASVPGFGIKSFKYRVMTTVGIKNQSTITINTDYTNLTNEEDVTVDEIETNENLTKGCEGI